jgi:paraquat-inducible protein B
LLRVQLMSQKANPTFIGLFIVIGVVLGVAGLIAFSSGKWFRKQERFILYFNASLKGLNPGAPVKLQGVTIGSVVDVLIAHNQKTNDFAMPVIIEINQNLLQAKSDRFVDIASQTTFEGFVKKGLRGKLDAESLVTGVLYIELEILRDATPPVFHQLMPEYPEIPTVPSTIQELLSNLTSFDLPGLSEKLNRVLDRLDQTIGELDMRQLSAGLTNLLGSLDRLVNAPDLTNSLAGLRLTLEDTRAMIRKLDGRVDPIADGVTNTLHQAQQTLAELRRGVENFSGLVAPNAPLQSQLHATLDELGTAARAVTDFAEFLKRHPNALITGKKNAPTKP